MKDIKLYNEEGTPSIEIEDPNRAGGNYGRTLVAKVFKTHPLAPNKERIELAAELVKRYNLHPDLVHLCELVAAGNTDYDRLEEIASDILTKLNA